ncbi:regucalcin isoform X1 [Mesocricetus auratus]|uniref:Regucalcin n=2 Tax=Mesocricetus auratus TaxID=10036 RepID=A0ABM2W7F6_MESAU|nr:regucalcin isoform X1 [Mesocricetus auratus]XP_040586712.1 regucalcin isoform X1 [Mesocricetus auratus]
MLSRKGDPYPRNSETTSLDATARGFYWRSSAPSDSAGSMASPRVQIQAVVTERHRMGECPVWEEATGQLVYVDIHAQTVCRWGPHSTKVQAVHLGHRVGCVALRGQDKGGYVVAAGTCLGFLDWDSEQVQWVAQLDRQKPHNRFNDGKVDPAGRFVAGTMPEPLAPGVWEPAQGSLYSLQGNHSVLRLADRLGIPNGLDWSTDQRTFYHVDSLDYAVHAYDYDVQAGTIGNRRLLFQLPPGRAMPDGLCVDSVGTLWVACIDGGKIIRLDPQTGSCLCTVDLPVTRVTSCCFGGPDYSDLYVTSAADGLSQEQLQREPQAGHVFKVSGLGVRGRPCFPFLG